MSNSKTTSKTTTEPQPEAEPVGEVIDVEEIIAEARRPERAVQVCMRADLNARFDELDAQLRAAAGHDESLDGQTLVDDTPGDRQAIVDEMDRIQDEMRQHYRTFRARALPRNEWWDFDKQRREHAGKGLPDGYVDELVARCMINPKMTSEQVGRLFDALGSSQVDAIFAICWNANIASVDVPKSFRASQIREQVRSG